MTRKHTKTK